MRFVFIAPFIKMKLKVDIKRKLTENAEIAVRDGHQS